MKMYTDKQAVSRNVRNRARAELATVVVATFLSMSSNAASLPYTLNPGVIPTKTDVVLNLQRTIYSGKFVCGIADQGKTFAQVNQGLGAAPPLGRDHAAVKLLPIKSEYYHDFQPGTYSTALNIFNPSLNELTIAVRISSDSLDSPKTVATISIPRLNAARVGCADIEAVLPDDFRGTLVEGFFHITRFNPDIQVQAVYTYTSLGAFQEFRGGAIGEGLEFFPVGAGGGAGGLGLGASVDIETVQPLVLK